jgi:hypothetical protein
MSDTENIEQVNTRCQYCSTENKKEANYCNECGGVLHDLDAEKLLGIKITDEDITDYVILGTVKKTVQIGKVSVGIRTLKSGEWKSVNIAAESVSPGKQITFTIEQNQLVCAHGLWMVRGNDKLVDMSSEARYEYIQNMASDFVEIVSSKILLLHKVMMAKVQEGTIKNF